MTLSQDALIIENFLQIPDKEGKDVPFALNPAQRRLDQNFTGRDIVPKARQEGISSYMLAKYTVKCLYKRNTRAVVISHDQESTERLFKRVRYFINNFRGASPSIHGQGSKREITFPKTGSTFYIGTAGSRKFGRGDTITDLHCSEVAFWENPKELFSGLSDAVPVSTGSICLESTGNGHNWYYKRTMDAIEGRSPYTVHFFNWQDFPEYDLPYTKEEEKHILDTLDPTYEEDHLWEQGLLTIGQLKFRRLKLAEKDWDLQLFKQEYPMSLDECFQTTSTGLFAKVRYNPQSNHWKLQYHTNVETLYADERHPIKGYHYVAGLDPSEGVGNDNGVIEIVCLETGGQVAEWTTNKLEQDMQGKRLIHFGRIFNNAFTVIERNKGQVALKTVLDSDYPVSLIYRESGSSKGPLGSYGVYTSATSKPLLVGMLRTFLRDDWTIFSEHLKSELDTFKEHPSGKLEAEEGCKDDRVMAMVMCAAGYQRAAVYMGDYNHRQREVEAYDPFTLDSVIKELTSGRKENRGFPIKPQVRGY
jgi:hypothetical protein